MRHLARIRRLLARRPWIYWTIVVAVAGGGAVATSSVLTSVDATRARWGNSAVVLVTTRDVAPGEPMSGLTAERRYPIEMIPPDAVESLSAGATARHRLRAHEIVVDVDVAASTTPHALIPDTWLAVAIAEPVPSGATVGDRVVVVSEGIRLADEALVVGRADGVTVVAVPDAAAPAVAAAAGSPVGLALLLRP